MSNIEPTEEQMQAARDCYEDCYGDINVDRVAHLLAAREHELRARIAELEERSARRLDDGTAIDALVYAIACLELQPGSERDRAVRDALNRVIDHVGAIEVRARDSATKVVGTLVAGAKAREDALTARVAESSSKQHWGCGCDALVGLLTAVGVDCLRVRAAAWREGRLRDAQRVLRGDVGPLQRASVVHGSDGE